MTEQNMQVLNWLNTLFSLCKPFVLVKYPFGSFDSLQYENMVSGLWMRF